MINEEFKKFIIKQIKKTDRYKLKKKEIGKIRSLNFTHLETKVLRHNQNEYCECTDFICNINADAATIYFRIFTDGSIELYD
jgi:hypothetical protein